MQGARKHYLESHRVGDDVLIAAEAYAYAARTPGARVELVEGAVVTIQGEAEPEQIRAFAADARSFGAAIDAAVARRAA